MSIHTFAQRFWMKNLTASIRCMTVIACLSTLITGGFIAPAAFADTKQKAFQRSIIDKRRQLNPKFKKRTRKNTQYIIVHTSEGGLTSTLRTVSKGKKCRNGRQTNGGHAHYAIARDGRTFRIMDKRYRADHAGLSMWNGQTNISRVSIGIELVGYHYTPITASQYRSVTHLLDILQRIYRLDDLAVLTHSQVAYGKPHRWFKQTHRGRKRCAKNFDRSRAGLGPTWRYDPDVKAGRLAADPELASIYYARRSKPVETVGTNVISSNTTAWSIAGEEYDSPTTLYRLPNGKSVPGDQIESKIGWNRIPKNTVVLLNQCEIDEPRQTLGPVKRITNGYTAWDIANLDYNKTTTFYFFPSGRIKHGREISDWDELPLNTRMIIGYRGPYRVTGSKPAVKIAGVKHNKKETLYYFPNKKIVPGDSVRDFKRLPKGVLIFLPASG